MDDKTDLAWYAIEKKFGPLPPEKDKWEKIEDGHYPECPTAIAAREKRISTCCMCAKIEIAEQCRLDSVE